VNQVCRRVAEYRATVILRGGQTTKPRARSDLPDAKQTETCEAGQA
jgi:hypothetical protein